jgi:peptidoglycan/xylan/chitin deacetylase (PgdA/CDA1 family)
MGGSRERDCSGERASEGCRAPLRLRQAVGPLALALSLCSGSACLGRAPAAPPTVPPRARSVAITIDDLPLAALEIFHDPDDRARIVAALCNLIRTRHLPATGFVIGSSAEHAPELIARWKQVGIQLGNHTWSHPDLRLVGPDAYIRDLRRGDHVVRALVPQQAVIPFRYPFLSEGFDPQVREAVQAALAQLGSPIAPVTILTRDWYYSTGFSEARMRSDPAAARRWIEAWRWDMQEATLLAEEQARELFGREPPQILLIHANEANAMHLAEYLDWMEARGYRFVSLAEALRDPAYRETDPATAPDGLSRWVQLQRSRELARGRQGLGEPLTAQ